jgi:fucose permease
MYIGNECTYGVWISSYAVLTHVADNKKATVFPSIFWITLSLCRFVMVFVSGSSSNKLKWLIVACFWSGIVSLLIIYAGYI